MVRAIAVLLCGALAACSQTADAPQAERTAATRGSAKAAPAAAEQHARCREAVDRQRQKSMNAAMLGGALSMVGGFAGVGGEGAAIAGQAASVGGSLVQASAENSARAAVEKECMP